MCASSWPNEAQWTESASDLLQVGINVGGYAMAHFFQAAAKLMMIGEQPTGTP